MRTINKVLMLAALTAITGCSTPELRQGSAIEVNEYVGSLSYRVHENQIESELIEQDIELLLLNYPDANYELVSHSQVGDRWITHVQRRLIKQGANQKNISLKRSHSVEGRDFSINYRFKTVSTPICPTHYYAYFDTTSLGCPVESMRWKSMRNPSMNQDKGGN